MLPLFLKERIMLTYEYRGYGGVKPKKPDPINALLCGLLYQVALQHFTSIIEPTIKDIYESYDGENDLFGENGRINIEGNLTKHIWNRYNQAISIVNGVYKSTNPDHLDIQKYALLPDLSFAAVLRDGTVMVEVDKE